MIRAGREDHRHTHARRQRRDAELGVRPASTPTSPASTAGARRRWSGRRARSSAPSRTWRRCVLGRDPRDIEQLVRVLTKHGFWRLGVIGMSAICGIEMACWDIFGKSLGVPVWRLLGGQDPRPRAGLHPSRPGRDDGGLREPRRGAAGRARARGGRARLPARSRPCSSPTPTTRPARARSTRWRAAWARCARRSARRSRSWSTSTAAAPRPRRRCNISRRWHRSGRCSSRSRCRRARPWGWRRSRRRPAVPIATGERLVDRREFDELFRARAVDIAQPDLCHVGGFGEARKIAAMAETANCGIAPHNPLGPIAGVAALHFDVATPNFVIQEEMVGRRALVRRGRAAARSAWSTAAGRCRRRPGLGIEIDEAVAAKPPVPAGGPARPQRRAGRRHRGRLVTRGGPAAGQGRDRHRRRPGIGEATARGVGRRGCAGRRSPSWTRRRGARPPPSSAALFVPCDVREPGAAGARSPRGTLGRLRPHRHPGRQCRHQRLPRAAGDARGGMAPLLRGRPRRRLALLPRRAAGDAGAGRRLDRQYRLLPQLRASSRTPSPTPSPSTRSSACRGRSGSSTRPSGCA